MQINYRIQTHEYNYLVVTPQVLNRLNETAIEKGYNRSLRRGLFKENLNDKLTMEDITDRVILDGIPIQCILAMPHYHKAGKLTMPHVRASFNVPTVEFSEFTSGNDGTGYKTLEWTQVTIDIDGDEWENIPTIRPYAWLDIPESNFYEKALYEDAQEKFKDDAKATIEQVEDYLAEAEKNFFRSLSETEEE